MRVPWTARRSNQSTLKEINLEYPLEGLMVKLKLQYFGHMMQMAHSLEKILRLGNIEGKRRRGQQVIRWLENINSSVLSLLYGPILTSLRDYWKKTLMLGKIEGRRRRR